MGKFRKQIGLILCMLLICSLSGITVSGQQSSLEIIGTAEYDMTPLANARVSLTKDGSTVQTIYTNTKGEFRFYLDINSEYVISIDKEGLLGKKIAFNTDVPSEFSGRWTMEFAMGLFPGCEGVDISALKDPVDRVKFSTNKEEFISDEAYVQNMRGRIEKLLIDIDNCQNQKYQDAMREGEQLMDRGQYAEAVQKFEEALEVYPADRAADRKINEAQKKMGESQQNQLVYAAAVKEADRLYNLKDYQGARSKYNEALRVKSDDYARTRVAEIDNLLREQQQAQQVQQAVDQQYNNYLAQANQAYSVKNYEAAQRLYEQALTVKPDAAFPKQRITELAPLIEKQKQDALDQQAVQKAYTEALAMGQSALQANDLETARQHFNRALMMKPEESYPKQMIAEVDRKIAEQKTAQVQAQKTTRLQEIEKALDDGDALMAAKDYQGAQAAYQRALQLDPNDAYAKRQVSKAQSMFEAVEVEKQQALEKSFTDAVSRGDELAAAASYQQAIEIYKQALLQKPDDPEVQSKLEAARQQLALQQQKQINERERKQQYDNYLAQANTLFDSRQYEQARQAYQSAAVLFPDQVYPRNRLREIDRILAEQQKLEQYNLLIARADGLFNQKNYEAAKTSYQQAITLNATDTYPKQKIAEIDAIVQQNARLAEEQGQRDAQYTRTVQEADNLLALSRLPEAKSAYQRALDLKPGESYPQQQIAKIDGMIADQIKRENDQKALDQQYASLIASADRLFGSKSYAEAKTTYQQALALKGTEIYPRQKISEIDALLGEQERFAAEQRMRDQQYNQVITEADNLMKASKLAEARSAYQRALGIKSGESYPSGQIAQIDAMLEAQARTENEKRALEQQYNLAIAQADQDYNQNKYEEAKTGYQKALSLKPGETYPVQQISRIDAQLARIEQERQQKAAFEQKYNNLITLADRDYGDHNYPAAKESYTEALSMKPGEKYPQEQLNKIAEFERIIALQEANRQSARTTTTTASQTRSSAPKKLSDLKFANDSEREKYLNSLRSQYPEGITLEIYKEKNQTTYRYVVIRGSEVREFRKVKFSWGGLEFSDNGIPTTGQYFDSQVKQRPGEFYQEFNF